ncbi:syndecan [Tribolium castaneum]|uniref:Syndecan n=1 Tax=Tribolium castaneum TaxID=7070 RepID=D6W7L7_TRICA|nr:PREDICTED: syndecan [Tribolium castaneum]EFA11584.2 syndecan [Tribolium castaneum]|eukprot:XP_008199397.1 PREDICTED: syndecan [Tribolium castaneum]
MYLRICSLLCCAILFGFATAAQGSGPRNSDITFTDDADIEGSGIGEVTHDLESSGSGFGPDDEDTPLKPHVTFNPNVHSDPDSGFPRNNIETSDRDVIVEQRPKIESEPAPPSPTNNPEVTMNRKTEDRHTSFFAQPGILAAVIGGAVVGLLCAILVVMFIVYRMRKKDEGSYALGEPKQSPTTTSYSRGNNKEFYA